MFFLKKKKFSIFSFWSLRVFKNKLFFKKLLRYKNSWWSHFCRQSGFFLNFFSFFKNLNDLKKKVRINSKLKNIIKYSFKNNYNNSIIRYTMRRNFEWVSTGISISLLPVFTKSYYRSLFRITSFLKFNRFRGFYKLYYYNYYRNLSLFYKNWILRVNKIKVFFKKKPVTPNRKSIVLSINHNFINKFFCNYKEINFKLRYLSFFSQMLNDKFDLKLSIPKTYFKTAIGGIYKHF